MCRQPPAAGERGGGDQPRGEGAAGLQGHPAVLLPPAGEGQTLADQGLLHLVSAGVDDAGAQEHPILRQQSGDLSGQGMITSATMLASTR